jgi:glycosyltransferase involved in cell wall biosynthesis
MKRLRIATLFTELGIGGDENRALTFAERVDRGRFDHCVVTVVSSDEDSERRFGPMAARYRAAGVRCLSLDERRRADCRPLPQPLSAGRDAARTLRIAARLARLFRRERIDVVDARMTYSMVIGLLAARLAGVPVAIATEYYVDFWRTRPWRWIAPAVFDGFDAIVSDSRWALDRYRQDLQRPLAHGVVVPNGVPEPRATRSRADVRRAIGLPEDAYVIGQVARVIHYKGQRQLVQAAAGVLAKHPDVWFLICGYDAGDPEFAAALRGDIATLGLADRVRMTPWPGDIGDVWHAIDLHAHPSLLDSSPIAIHESMALGLPAVVSSAGGIPELVENEATGLVVPPHDAGALAAAIVRILDEPQLGKRLGAAARRRYAARHRPEQMTRAIEELMVDTFARKQRSAPVAAHAPVVAAGG